MRVVWQAFPAANCLTQVNVTTAQMCARLEWATQVPRMHSLRLYRYHWRCSSHIQGTDVTLQISLHFKSVISYFAMHLFKYPV
jgi:hypothetical protein